MTMKRAWTIYGIVVAVGYVVLLTLCIKAQISEIGQSRATLARYHEMCRALELRLELAADDADQVAKGDVGTPRDQIRMAVEIAPSLLNGCATTPPIDTDVRDLCWLHGDMTCIAHELRLIAHQLPQHPAEAP